MYCPHCGTALSEGVRFCSACGGEQTDQDIAAPTYTRRLLVGFSPKITDPAFANYVKNTNRWAAIFSVILAVAAVIGFTVAGEMGVDGMGNPDSLFIGLGVGGMFLTIALFQILGRKRSTTWDGTVEDKTVKKKTERRNYGNDDYGYEDYLEYTVVIRSDHGKRQVIRAKNDDTLYNYYRVGDRVRHHAGLKSYEKYDKSGDSIIFCNACATLCDINDDICFRCKCPLLK
ncbi:MAG TPA: zinc-ribbon domain-containing protein [Negativicutes bacterium]|nr:zinc-ribbon domain-containing protein [Negativicutes bacterium]